jgi:sugar-phosphatase
MIRAVIFDLDGLLIDSEPLWREAEFEVFSSLGISLDHEMTKQTMGLRVDEVVEYWYKIHPWKTASKIEVASQIDKKVHELIKKEGVALPGALESIKLCKSKNLPIAIASSSSTLLIDTVVSKFRIGEDIKILRSAHNEIYGKPHPAVFISTLDGLNNVLNSDIRPEECLVLEDSINGIIAAKAARMNCIAVPQAELESDIRLGIADHVLKSLDEFTYELLDSF